MNELTKSSDFISISGMLDAMPAHWQENYLGLWAVQESFLRDIVNRFGSVDIPLHIQTNAAEIRAELQRIQGGYAVDVDDGIAVVRVVGVTSKHYNSFTRSTSTLMMRRTLRALRRDTAVRGVLLYIDSPGGAVAGQKAFADELASLAAEKPVFAFIEDLGASAAYWTASQATRVYANDMAVVGSIGTYGVVHDSSEMAEKAGVKVHVIRAGEMKGVGVPGTEITDAHLAKFQREVEVMNEFFLSAVANGRDIPLGRVRQLATGDVWIGSEALALGLIDDIGTFDSVILALRDEVGQMESDMSDELTARVAALEQELAEAEEAKATAAARVEELENEARAKRFTDLVGQGDDAWFGERETHLLMLSLLADHCGEGSEEFLAYVRQQNALSAQLADSLLYKEIGSNNEQGGDAAQKLSALARQRADEQGITFALAYTQVLEENPQLYSEYKATA